MIRRVGLVCALALTASMPISAQASPAERSRPPLAGFGSLTVDQARHQVFVSGGAGSNAVLVTDFSGHLVKRISHEPGAAGLALGADGRTVYAALSTGDAVSAIDTTSLTETARYATPSHSCPTTLTRTGGYLWFGYGCADQVLAGVGRVDTTSSPVGVTLDQQGDTQFHSAPLVSSATGDAGPLVAAQPGASASMTTVYAVRGGAPRAGASGVMGGGDLADIAVNPAGSLVFTAAGSRSRVEEFATADLSSCGAYQVGRRVTAVAVSPDGRYLAAASLDADHAVRVFRVGATRPTKVFHLGVNVIATGGLAWSADQHVLFAVTHRPSGAAPTLRPLPNPTG